MSKTLVGVNSTVGSKARESAKTMSLAFVLLDFQHAGQCQKKSRRSVRDGV